MKVVFKPERTILIMPISDDEELKLMLAERRITAISVDTNIFDQKRLQLSSASMQALVRLNERMFRFILSGTVAREVVSHLKKAAEDAIKSAKKSIGAALFAYGTENPTRDQILEQISGSRTPAEAADQRWNQFIRDTGCDILDDATLVSTATIYDAYFTGQPPFGSGRKKDEFPDALALNALEQTAEQEGTSILVVSSDGDWHAYCQQSQRLFLVPQIERALALITNAPIGLKSEIRAWLAQGGLGNEEAKLLVADHVERFEFSVNAHPTHGDVEIYAMAGELEEVAWPNEDDIDIIEIETVGEDGLRVVASMPLGITMSVPVELSFSIWDAVDRESVSMGSRSVEVEQEVTARASFTLDIHDLGTEDQSIEITDSEIEDSYYEIDLDQVDVFDPQDYYDENEPS